MTLGQGHRKVIQYITQTHIFFVPNIYGLAQTVLTWEAKVVAAADADAAETNWKHKVTPDWGDSISLKQHQTSCSTYIYIYYIYIYIYHIILYTYYIKTSFPCTTCTPKSMYNGGHKLKHFSHNSCRVTHKLKHYVVTNCAVVTTWSESQIVPSLLGQIDYDVVKQESDESLLGNTLWNQKYLCYAAKSFTGCGWRNKLIVYKIWIELL